MFLDPKPTINPEGELEFALAAPATVWRLIVGYLADLCTPVPYDSLDSQEEQEAAARAIMSISYAVPIGTIVPTIRQTAPPDWLICDGSGPYAAAQGYEELVAVAHPAWRIDPVTGRDAQAVWLPDLRGRVPVGAGAGEGLSPRAQGERGGEEKHLMTNAELLPHSHVFTHTHTYNYPSILAGVALTPGELPVFIPPVTPLPTQTSSTGTMRTSNQGGGYPFNVMQPYLVVNYMIKAK